MSFYWRWVVVRTAVAAVMAILIVAEGVIAQLWCWPGYASTYKWPVWLAACGLVSTAEFYVLRTRYPTLSGPLYIAVPLLLPAWLVAVQIVEGRLWSIALISDPDMQNTGARILVQLTTTGIYTAGGIIYAFLSWIALRRVAHGFAIWTMWIAVAVLAATLFALYVPVRWGQPVSQPDYLTALGMIAAYVRLLTSSLVYSLISGIGVARLTPKPWSTS